MSKPVTMAIKDLWFDPDALRRAAYDSPLDNAPKRSVGPQGDL